MTTVALANRYARLTFAEMPHEVVARARESVLDTLGVAIRGQALASTSVLVAVTSAMGGRREATIIGRGRAPAALAALANAVAAHGCELDDVDNSSSVHPGAVVIPAAFAVGEMVEASGRDVLAAVVVGYDAMIRIGRASGAVQLFARGFHPTSVCGVFGAAVAAARLLELDSDEMANALGIAGSLASGNLEFMSDGAWTKRLQVGTAAQSGVLAALLAHRGYKGPTTALEGRHGFLFSHSAAPRVGTLNCGLERPYAIMDVSTKRRACCRYSHAALEATLALVAETGIEADQVARVDVGLVSAAIGIVCEPRSKKLHPRNTVDAQFSLPYAIAAALARKDASVEEFTDETIADPTVRRLMPLVHSYPDSDLDEMYPKYWPARVKITLTSGAVQEMLLKNCPGDPEMPFSQAELECKFRRLAGAQLAPEALSSLIEQIGRLDNVANVRDVMTLVENGGVAAAMRVE